MISVALSRNARSIWAGGSASVITALIFDSGQTFTSDMRANLLESHRTTTFDERWMKARFISVSSSE